MSTIQQPGWGTCTRCGGLFFKPHAKTRRCKAGGVHHFEDEHMLTYALDANGQENWVDNLQVGANQEASWAWCHKCKGLFFVSKNGGICDDGNKHDNSESSPYILTKVAGTPDPGSGAYYQCSHCFGLYSDLASRTKCNNGKAHHHKNTNHYYILEPHVDHVDPDEPFA